MKAFEEINSLIQLDIDAVEAYDQAIKNTDHGEIRANLQRFQKDHESHIETLSKELKKLGEKPPERTKDIKGFLIEGFTAIRSLTGTEGALKAMLMNEKLTTKTYHDALDCDTPAPVKDIIRKNYEDEKRHLKYIQEALDTRFWKQGAA